MSLWPTAPEPQKRRSEKGKRLAAAFHQAARGREVCPLAAAAPRIGGLPRLLFLHLSVD